MTSFCGYIALVGRPNVGKSTLLNQILKQKLSITSRKPQTTRHRILGIHTAGDYQLIYVDTPGIHQGSKKTINRLMNKAAISALNEVDVIVFITEALIWKPADEYVLQLIQRTQTPCILVINKIDKIANKQDLLPWIDKLQSLGSFADIIPLSARTGIQVAQLEESLKPYLPPAEHLFAEEEITDRSVKFLCAELLREKIFRFCGEELPYSTTIEIESFKEEEKLVRIHALILVDKENHKRMIIGNKGQKLKEMATQARLDMEMLLAKKVLLKCWCKVKPGWAENEKLLNQLGYGN